MLQYLFRCSGCDQEFADPKFFPLCAPCSAALVAAPELCARCGDAHPSLPATCPNDHGFDPASIDSFHAIYWLLTPGYQVLKRWKTRGGPAFDRRVLKIPPSRLASLRRLGGQCAIPIPQSFQRSWRLGRSPAELLASWIARELRIPCISALESEARPRQRRQAELSAEERLSNAIGFRLRRELLGTDYRSVLLVDDFMTTGHTLRRASRALREGGFSEIHALCLGVRLRRTQSFDVGGLELIRDPALHGGLMERVRRPVTVGQETQAVDA